MYFQISVAAKFYLKLKLLDGEKDTCKSDKRLAKTVANAFDQAEKQYLAGLKPDIICMFVFNAMTRTLFSRKIALHSINQQYQI